MRAKKSCGNVYHVYNRSMSSRDVIKRMQAEGWRLVRTKGSHRQYKHPERAGLVTVPHPKKDLPAGTVRAIYKQAGWSD